MKRVAKILVLCGCFMAMPLLMAPRNGTGTYQLPAGNPVQSGTTISSTVHNNTMSDIATALTASIAKDGQTTPTANLPMGGFRHTGVGTASARNHYGVVSQIQDGDYNLVGSVSGTNTITGNLTPAITAYVAGSQVVLIPANANTGATTLNLNGIGALDVQKYNSGGQVAIAANDLRAGIPALLILDTGSDDWILLNPYSGSLGDVTIGTLTATTINASGTITGGNLTTAGTVTSATISNSGTTTSGTVAATSTLTVAGQSARDATNLFNTGTVPAARLPGSFNGFANPSATIGLSATNGSAATAMRSDAAPALSQSITPTWTGQHKFTATTTFESAAPFVQWNETGVTADNGLWQAYPDAEQFVFRVINDAQTVASAWLTVDRTGTTVDKVAFPTDNAASNFVVGPAAGFSINNARMQVRTASSGVSAAQFVNGGSTGPVVAIVSGDSVSDNGLISFSVNSGVPSVVGSITYNRTGGVVAYNTTSDARLKKNFKSAPSAKQVIDCIPVDSYDWKDSGKHVVHGLVAQRLNKCAPYAVTQGDIWQIDPSKLVPALIKYVQEQEQRISKLEAQLKRMH